MKNIKIIMIFLTILFSTTPYLVFATGIENNSIEVLLKDGSKNVDFNYELSLSETFDYLYNNVNVGEFIKSYINSKLPSNYSSIVDPVEKTYQILESNELIYNGKFSYSYEMNLNVELMNTKEESIINYLKENTNIKDPIEAIPISNNRYKIIINNKANDFNINFISEQDNIGLYSENNKSEVSYSTHIQNIGWQNYIKNGEISGTTGKSLRLEGIKIKIDNKDVSGSVEYQTHIQNIGWQNYVKENESSGTTGKSLRLEAIRIRLTGKLEKKYDIYYCVHIEKQGWLGWAKNGEDAGSVGLSYRLEGIKIKLVPKGSSLEEDNSKNGFYERTPNLYSSEHVQNIGWIGQKANKETIGTTGKSLRLEALKLSLSSYRSKGDIEYSVSVQNKGWQDYVKNNNIAGTIGQKLKLEAVKIRITDQLAENFDIYYRVHVSDYGWMGWASNNQPAGMNGLFSQIEAIQIKIIPKGYNAPGNTDNAYIEKSGTVKYASHISEIGWQDYVENGELSGTTGKSQGIESIKIDIGEAIEGNVEYQTYIENKGWQEKVSNNSVSGTVGKTRHIEAIKINLTGELEKKYDIYYRVHVASIGWLDWAKNGMAAGNNGNDKAIEAIEIQLINKGFSAPGQTDKPYVTGHWSNGKYYDYFGNMANDFKVIDGVKYFFNSLGKLIGKNVKKVIDVSKWQETIDWKQVSKYNDIDGVIVRAAYRGSKYANIVEDENFYQNVVGATKQGYNVGAYFFSQATTKEEAIEEANKIVEMVRKAGGLSIINMPIVFDTEKTWYKENGIDHPGRANGLTREKRTEVAKAFLDTVKSKGYTPMIYASKNFLDEDLDMSKLSGYKLWIAQYNHECTYTGKYEIWQYSSKEQITGINGNVDGSVWFS